MEGKTMIDTLGRIAKEREADAATFEEHDGKLCMLCDAYGNDKRSLFIRCFYNMKEAIPEMLDVTSVDGLNFNGYYLRICKHCRGELLQHLQEWRAEAVRRRSLLKTPDGMPDDTIYEDDLIPVRHYGKVEFLTADEYKIWKERQ